VTKVLLSIHVLVAILAIGPVAVAASMFPAAARAESGAALSTLHRICRVYAAIGIVVPVFGLATAGVMGVTGNAWVIVSIALTGLAAGVLVVLVLPAQGKVLAGERLTKRLAMHTGLFNLLWAAVTVLMIVRPGSTTGA
jgi:hypothetical protein